MVVVQDNSQIIVTEFPAGNYNVVVHLPGGEDHSYSNVHLDANGKTSFSVFYGYPGTTVSITIRGWGNATPLVWY